MGKLSRSSDRAVSIPAPIQEFLDLLEMMPDRADRIDALISMTDSYKVVGPEQVSKPYPENHRVPGCESEIFAWAFVEPNGLRFEFAVENPQGISAMAWAAILKRGLDGLSPEEVQEVPDELVYQVFGKELSMGKSMGLMNTLRLCKSFALRLESEFPVGGTL